MVAANLEDLDPEQWDQICLANLLAATMDHAYFKDGASRFVRVSAGVIAAAMKPRAELRGLQVTCEADLIGKTDFDLFTDAEASAAFTAEQAIISTGTPLINALERQTWPDRPPTYVLTNKMPLRGRDGTVVGTFGLSRDVTDDLLVRRQLATVLATSPDGIGRLDTSLRYVYVNPAAALIHGAAAEDIVGRTDAEMGRDDTVLGAWLAALRRVLDSGEPTRLEHETAGSFYESRFVAEADGEVVTGILVVTRDITDRKRAELALAEQAVRDPLTGLANRVLLLDRLDQSLVRLHRSPGTIAVLFLDLDRFKVINDSLGHVFGDWLLREVAERLDRCARRSDTLARFGGDEFVMLCDRVAAAEDARAIVERIGRALAEPFAHEGHVVHINASVGITTTSDPGASAVDLVRDADTAMYQAKERGRGSGRYEFFDPSAREGPTPSA
ncbi:MAG: hypothetical protein QOG52_1292 [Frankiaceae bacterium]|nr:hypothetical protein [Frankiaceae bacterium]